MNLATILLSTAPEGQLFSIKSGEELVMVIVLGTLLLIGILLLAATLYVYRVVKKIVEPEVKPEAEPLTIWQRFLGLAPLKKEKDLVMEHKYDGIEELDNPTPPWFMGLFYGTIAIGAAYLLVYHVVGSGDIMVEEYTQEVTIAEKQREIYLTQVAGSINENTVTLVKDAKDLDAGKTLFSQYCTACHGQNAEGKVGPNLTDEFWLHGGSIKNIFHTITEGVPEKGMVAWRKQLNPLQIQQISSYILTLQGSNPQNAKEPQGEKMAAEAVAAR